MPIEEIRAELAGYHPGTEAMVERSAEHRERARLWQRLDQLTKPGAGGRSPPSA
jgi:hypothetical protein